MTTQSAPIPQNGFMKNPVDVAIRIGVLVLWASWCFRITRPFLETIV